MPCEEKIQEDPRFRLEQRVVAVLSSELGGQVSGVGMEKHQVGELSPMQCPAVPEGTAEHRGRVDTWHRSGALQLVPRGSVR